jgi:hypothetical protein
MIFDDSSSEEEEEDNADLEMALMMILNEDFWRPRRGSQFGRAWIKQNRAEGHARIMRDYFNPGATYQEKQFRWRFRMQKDLFLTISKAVEEYDDWFKLRGVHRRDYCNPGDEVHSGREGTCIWLLG